MIRIYPYLILFLISFWPVYLAFFKVSTASFNTITHYLPLRYNAIHTMFDGHLPLWNPHILSGMPLLGDAISNPFDPLNVLFIFLNPADAYGVMTSLQLFMAGSFMLIYLRMSLNLSLLSALLGGVLFIFNPVLVSGIGQRLDFINPLGSFLWLPVILVFLDRAMESDSCRCRCYVIVTGLISAISVFCGGFNFFILMYAFLLLHVFLSPGRVVKKIFISGAVGLLAVLVCSIQILPTMETASLGHRKFLWANGLFDKSGLDLISLGISLLSFPVDIFNGRPNVLVTSLSSKFNIDLKMFHLGIIEFFLVSIIFLSKAHSHKERAFKIMLGILLAFLVSIYYLPVRGLLDHLLPVFKGIHLGYVSFLFYFCFIVLAAISFDRVVHPGKHSPVVKRYALLFKMGIFSLSLSMAALFLTKYSPIWIGLLADPWNLLDLMRLFGFTLYLVTLCLSAVVIQRLIAFEVQAGWLGGAILVLSISLNITVLWEIEFFTHHLRPHLHKNSAVSRETKFLREMKSYERMEIYHGNSEYWRLMNYGFNLPMVYSAAVSGGSHQLMSLRYKKFYDMMNLRFPFDKSYYWKDGRYIWPSAYAYIDKPNVNRKCLDLLGVNYLFFRTKSDDESLQLITTGSYYNIYKNRDVLPRCFIVHEARVAAPEDILGQLSANTFDPLSRVMLEKNPVSQGIIHEPAAVAGSQNARCEFTRYDPNEVVISYASPATGFLVLTDAYDKAWKAYVDGKETEILQADYLFRAVSIPAGEHTVRFTYLPVSFVIGAFLTVSTLIIALGLYFFWRKK